MAKAIAVVMPETHHRLCIWQIHQNALKHMNPLFSGSKLFLEDFDKFVYDYEGEEEFLNSWKSMLEKYDLRDNSWFNNLFEGKKSTQLRESFNSHL